LVSIREATAVVDLDVSDGMSEEEAEEGASTMSRHAPAAASSKESRTYLLLERDTLLLLGSVTIFHVANSAQLPALGQKFDALSRSPSTRLVLFGLWPVDGLMGISLCTIIAQATMILVAVVVKWLTGRLGLKRTLLLSYTALPIRSMINAYSDNGILLLTGQLLDAVGDGSNGVLSVLMLEHIARSNPNHFAFLQGMGYTARGLGASISNILTSQIIDRSSGDFRPAFQALGLISLVPIVLTLCLRQLGTASTLLFADGRAQVWWSLLAVLLLCASCSMMITAWYLHLKFEGVGMLPAILFSWLLAGGEYALQVPANRLGAHKAGLTPAQLRGVAEMATLIAFLAFQSCVLDRPVLLNHIAGFGIVFVGVLIVLSGPWTSTVCAAEPKKGHKLVPSSEAEAAAASGGYLDGESRDGESTLLRSDV